MKITREYISMWGLLIISTINIDTDLFWFWFVSAVLLYIIDIINQLKK